MKTVKIDIETHKVLKLMAVKYNLTIPEMISKLVAKQESKEI